jgi:hypothetical protein
MPQTCSICKHPEKQAIEIALVRKIPMTRIAQQTGTGMYSIRRHAQHMAASVVLRAPHEVGQTVQAVSLLDRVQGLMLEIRQIAEQAKKNKNWTSALGAMRELRGCLELLGKLSGELTAQTPGPKVSVGVIVNSGQPQPENDDSGDLELTLAKYVCEATNNFDATEIERMKQLCSRVFLESTPHAGIGPPQLIESTARDRPAVRNL